MDELTRVLFVCVHNSARSQMAEALLRKLGGERFLVESAGFEPEPVSPLAVAVMQELGLDISAAKSRAVFDLFREGRRYDFVIAVCDQAAAERCPIFPGYTQRLSWSFADPAKFRGSDGERLAHTRSIRDAIQAQISAWLQSLADTRDKR